MNGFYFNFYFRQDLQDKQDIIFTRFPLAAIACRHRVPLRQGGGDETGYIQSASRKKYTLISRH
jgi:hypothetical protein